MNKNRKKNTVTESAAEAKLKGFLDMIAPSVIQFYTDHYICGNTYRSVWALREYPTATDEQAILRHLGEKDGVTLRIYTRQVTPTEEKKIISNAANKNRMKQGNTENLQETVTAASNLQDVTTIIATMHRSREPLLHTAVFIELSAPDLDKLKLLQTEVLTELIRSKLNVDRLLLRQKQGFMCVHPVGRNVLGEQFERALPASSVANLFPFNYSGKTDKNGFYIGRDKFGSNVIVDFNQRADDKTNANILILGNSGQGKSYLLKLILTILRESGMKVICLDPEHEYIDLTNNLGGCFVDLMSGEYIINVLEPKTWDENGSPEDMDAPMAFQCSSKLSQHISFLKDFFRTYKNFTDSQIDTIEIMLGKYALAQKDGIRFEARVFIPSVLPFQSGHLAIIFGNLLENALEACRKLPQEQRYIMLEATYIKEMLQICIKNGSPEKLKKDNSGRYLTTKKDTSCHGIGLASVEQALADYDGELFTQYENGEFQASAVLYSNSIEEK